MHLDNTWVVVELKSSEKGSLSHLQRNADNVATESRVSSRIRKCKLNNKK